MIYHNNFSILVRRNTSVKLLVIILFLMISGHPTVAQKYSSPRESPRWDCRGGVTEHVIWRQKIGFPGPITVTQDYLLVGSNNFSPRDPNNKQDCSVLMCFSNKDGSFRWQAAHPRMEIQSQDHSGSPISSIPAVEKNRVYYTNNRGELICADILGFHDQENDGPFREEKNVKINDVDVIWKIDMKKKFHIHKRDASDYFNPTSSPLIIGDYVYCVTGHSRRLGDLSSNPLPPSFLAVHKMTGKVLWSSNAPGKNIIHAQWSSPVMISVEGQMQVIFPGGDGCLYGFHPENGRQLWKFDCNKPRKIDPTTNKPERRGFYFPRPVVRRDTIFAGISQGMAPLSSSQYPLYSLKLVQKAKTSSPEIKWIMDESRFFGTLGTVAIYNNVLFTISINGFVIALDVSTGKELWRFDLLGEQSAWGSPYIHDGKLFVPTHHRLFVFKVSRKIECLGQYIFDSIIRGTPVSDGKKLYITTNSHVWALRFPD